MTAATSHPATAARSANPVFLLLGGAVAASAALLLALGSRLTFLLDDWEFLIYRRGFNAHVILDPHGEHISIGPILIYKALLASFGMGSALPFRVVSTAVFLTSCVLLFLLLRRRVGDWLALIATVLVLFLGAAWEDLLWPFQIGYFGSVAAGLGMLLALEQENKEGDRLACLLLAVSTIFSSLGLAFIVAAAVQVGQRRESWRQRIYVVAIPAALYALWWIGWGHTAGSEISWHNLSITPRWVIDAISAGMAGLMGLVTPTAQTAPGGLDWGHVLFGGAVLFAILRLRRLGRAPSGLWVVAAAGATFWVLAALNSNPDRLPVASRYMYPSAVFILLIGAELLRGIRPRRGALAACAVIAAAGVIGNLADLHESYDSYKKTSDIERADLGALELARGTVSPGFRLSEDVADTAYVGVQAGPYFSAVEAFGSPAFSAAQIAAAPAAARLAADKVLGRALGITTGLVAGSPAGSGPAPRVVGPPGVLLGRHGTCVSVGPFGGSAPILDLPPGGAIVRSSSTAGTELRLRRFSSIFPLDLGELPARRTELIDIPADRSTVPWQLQVAGAGPVTICGRG
jgi:hypothetical protein